MKLFRKILFWLHLTAGVLGGIVILIMCVTGALLSFEKNILEYAESDVRYVKVPDNTEPLPVSDILAKLNEARPNAKPSSITVLNQANASVSVALGRDGQIFIDPYTGTVLGDGNKTLRGIFSVVESWHRWIALSGDGRPVGKAITGACNLMFLFLAISGIYIWFPRKISWKSVRPVLWFRRGVRGKARNFNWHNVIGFWTSLVLIVLTLTASVMSYQWANNLLYTLTGNDVPQQQQQGPPPNAQQAQNDAPDNFPETFEAVWDKAEDQAENWKSISLRLPIVKDAAIFTIDEGKYANIFGRSTLTVDTKTASVSKWEPYGQQNAGRQARTWVRFLHTGESGGFVGQLIGFIACVGGSFLVWTGLSLALRRFRNWSRKGKMATESVPDDI